eukprot:361663-Chlamydomonas_euryale.AAC.4
MAPKTPRPLRQTACDTKDLTPAHVLDALRKAKQNGKAKCWKFLKPVISCKTSLAALRCIGCKEAGLAVSNPSRMAAEHWGRRSTPCVTPGGLLLRCLIGI